MNIIPTPTTRISLEQRSRSLLNSLTTTQVALDRISQQLSSGRRLVVPSEDPADAAVAMQIRKRLESEDRYESSLNQHVAQLAVADNTMAEATDVVRTVRQLALDMANSGVPAETMEAQVGVVNAARNQLLSLANSDIQGSYLFAGDRLTDPPFRATPTGVVYEGGEALRTQVGPDSKLAFTVDGGAAFGGKSQRVQGSADLSPVVDANTRLADVAGVNDTGVTGGSVFVANGTASEIIDLTSVDSLGDIVDAINNAAVGGVTASVNAAGDGLQLTGGAGESISFKDLSGTLASDLGLVAESNAPGTPVVGGDVGAKLTELTPLANLPGGPDLVNGLTISLGDTTKTVDFAGDTTVGDLLNTVRSAFPDLAVAISADGTGIDIQNTIQGQPLSIAENVGTTAADLGLRTFTAASLLADFNGGDGIRTNVDGADLQITDSAGVSADLEIGNLTTVQDVIDTINASGVSVAATLGTNNGIVLTDTAGGAGTLTVASLGSSVAARDLGLDGDATAGVVDGRDVNTVEVRGVFASLDLLVEALRNHDVDGVRRAEARLEQDEYELIRTRGVTATRTQEFQARLDRVEDRRISAKSLLSELEDTNYAEAVARFQTLQTALQSTYRTGGTLLQVSLIDFLG